MAQQIQWFPGHMHKAAKEMRQRCRQVDAVIELRDARIPYSSANPLLAEIRADKPYLLILTKEDLADPQVTARWQALLRRPPVASVCVVGKNDAGRVRHILTVCRRLQPRARARQGAGITALVAGIPNVGKSTLINLLAGRAIAKTGNEPAITRQPQRIELAEGITLLDTPGVLWGNIANRHSGFRLAATGAIKDSVLPQQEVAGYLVSYLLRAYPMQLAGRYRQAASVQDARDFLRAAGRARGCLKPGGEVELDKIARLVVADYRAGLIGRISLETPEMMAAETTASPASSPPAPTGVTD